MDINAYILFMIALGIVIHHYIKHSQDTKLTTFEKFIQYDDINNHETWALFCIGIGIGILLVH